jgi:hypothetical protein
MIFLIFSNIYNLNIIIFNLFIYYYKLSLLTLLVKNIALLFIMINYYITLYYWR